MTTLSVWTALTSGCRSPGKTRPVSWLKPAWNEFKKFLEGPRTICLTASTIAAEGGKTDIAKPMHGLGWAVQLGEDVWVPHAFQKKSTKGVKTPKHEVDLIKDRLKRLKEMLK